MAKVIGNTVSTTFNPNKVPGGSAETQPDWNQNDSTAKDYVKNKSLKILRESEVGYFNDNFTYYYDPDCVCANQSTVLAIVNGERIEIPVIPGRYYEMGKLYDYGIAFTANSMTPSSYHVAYSDEKFPDGISSIQIIVVQYEKLPDEAIPDGLSWANNYDTDRIVTTDKRTFVTENSVIYYDTSNTERTITAENIKFNSSFDSNKKVVIFATLQNYRFGWKSFTRSNGGADVTETIYSITTNEPVRDSELPYGLFIMASSFNKWHLLNPHVKLIQRADGTWIEPNTLAETVEEQGNTIENLRVDSGSCNCTLKDGDYNVLAINHRGYSTTAPENTIPAYILSKEKGYNYVECDVSFTSDGVAVLLHDATIDRTSDGSGSISSLTYADVMQYDFGSWKSTTYAGTKIPTFDEFIRLCKNIGLHPYIELKSNGGYTQTQIAGIVANVEAVGMRGKVSYISFNATFLEYVKNVDPTARLGYLADITTNTVAQAVALRTGMNEVFMDVSYGNVTEAKVAMCITNDLPIEIWTVNTASIIESMNPYVSGVTSDNLIAGKILYDKNMTYMPPSAPDGDTVTLASISVTYSGGDVLVGTALTALSGIVVTAEYSDGSTETVAGYALTGTIAEGENTIMVTYQGKTAVFNVTGVSDGADQPTVSGIPLFQGRIDSVYNSANGMYINTTSNNYSKRVSYTGLDYPLVPGAIYTLVGVDGVRYGVQQLTKSGASKVQNKETLGTADKIDSGWQLSGYRFTADANAAFAWITASFETDTDIIPQQAMPVYIESETGSDGDILHNWDFRNSMTDTTLGVTATAVNSVASDAATTTAYRDSDGLHFDGFGQAVDLGNVFALNRTYEMDIAEYVPRNTSSNVRLIMFGADANADCGFVYRKNTTPGWSFYSSEWSTEIFTGLTERDAISGKTVTLKIASDGTVELLLDGTSYGTASVKAQSTWSKVIIGSAPQFGAVSMGGTFCDATVTGFRIYLGV